MDALLCAPLPVRLRLLEVFREQLEIEPQGAQVVLDLVDEAAREFSQLGVLLVGRVHGQGSGIRDQESGIRGQGSVTCVE